VLLALQRSPSTRLVALALAVAAAAGGLTLAWRAGRAPAVGTPDDTAGAAARAVLAGALLWTTVSAAFYGGWVVGPAVTPPTADAPTLARAARAVAATAYSALLALALLVAAVRLTRRGGAAAVFAPVTLATLWAAHELAKLNVFLGVANPGAELLPSYLAPLRAYFGPPRTSPLLAPSVAALAGAAVVAFAAARRAAQPARRVGWALVGGVIALAAFEHALLGARAPVAWWDAFLRWRGGA
jgi:putative photosynthetic complex assembly protein 2